MRLKRRVLGGKTMRNEILHQKRKMLGLTQKEASQKAGINIRQYQKFESGEIDMASVSLRIALAVCDVLELEPHCFALPKAK